MTHSIVSIVKDESTILKLVGPRLIAYDYGTITTEHSMLEDATAADHNHINMHNFFM